MKLTAKQKAAVERWCYLELADVAAESDNYYTFKDRYETQPEEISVDDDESVESQDVADLADDYFFVVMNRIAKEFRKRGKGK